MQVRYGSSIECPKCGKAGKFAKLSGKPAYSCARCAHHIHPMTGTLFEKSRTPLKKWFYAIYLFNTSQTGISARALQKELNVTLKTAWRIGNQIRKYIQKIEG